VIEPEPYEIPPVASRYRAGEAGLTPGPPKSFDLVSEASRAEQQAARDAAGRAAAPPDGGPKFSSSSPVGAPVGPPGRRVPRRVAEPGPLPGTIVPEWSLPAPKRSRRVGRHVAQLLVVALLGAGAYLVAPHVRTVLANRAVPADLQPYVKGGGVPYAPAARGYVVRLPSRPVTRDSLVQAAGKEPGLFVQRSIVAGNDFQIVIRFVDLTNPAARSSGLAGALHDPQVAGPAPINVRAVTFAGQPAFDYSRATSPATRARIFLRGARLYVISVQSKAAGAVLDAVAKSFRLTP
jgi:hypothetical protein